MKYIFASNLSPEQYNSVTSLYHKAQTFSIEQFPGFLEANTGTNVCHYIQTDDKDILTAYAQISIRKFQIATVSFGPLAVSGEAFKNALIHIKKYCSQKLIPVLRITPPYFISQYGERYFEELRTHVGFETSDKEINWSTMIIPITSSEEEIFKTFSDNHKRSIKKGIKMELRTELALYSSMIDTFSTQHSDMYEKRGLQIDRNKEKQRFMSLFHFFNKTDLGIFLMVFEKEQAIGGICCVIQGNTMRYLEGYSHPDYRQYPVTHLAFFEAIKIAREKGLHYFDLGGYANDVQEGDQLAAINRFKDGFRGELVNYPKTMIIYTLPFAKSLYSLKKG